MVSISRQPQLKILVSHLSVIFIRNWLVSVFRSGVSLLVTLTVYFLPGFIFFTLSWSNEVHWLNKPFIDARRHSWDLNQIIELKFEYNLSYFTTEHVRITTLGTSVGRWWRLHTSGQAMKSSYFMYREDNSTLSLCINQWDKWSLIVSITGQMLAAGGGGWCGDKLQITLKTIELSYAFNWLSWKAVGNGPLITNHNVMCRISSLDPIVHLYNTIGRRIHYQHTKDIACL